MIVDFISPQNLPHWIVWLDWNFYAHKGSLLVFIAAAIMLWVLWCLNKYGIAIG